MPPPGLRRGARPGRTRNKSPRGHRGYSFDKVAFPTCGRRPLQRYRCAWRSSYEPPVRGHRHYRQIVALQTLDRGTHGSASQNEIVFNLAVVALLFLLGLLCCVVPMLFLLRGPGFGGRDVTLDLPRQSLDLVNDPDVVVVPYNTRLRAVVRVPDRRRTQADVGQ